MPEFAALYSSITIHELVRALVTLCALAIAGYVIVSGRFEAKEKQWACGLVGTILGYWLGK